MKPSFNKSLLSFLIILSFCFISCKKKWLDEKTDKNITVPATFKDFLALIDNSSVMNEYSPSLGEIASDGHYVSDQVWNSNMLIDEERNAYTWSKSRPYINIRDWIYPYQRIFYCNVILDGIKKINPINNEEQTLLNNIKGNALFHRAKSFYELSQIYAPPYDITSAPTDLGIPLRISSDVNIPSIRPSVNATYEQIISDLIVAKDLLPIAPLYKTRASKPAILALLARISLSIYDYDEAFNYADECLSLYNKLIDYNTLNSTTTYPIGIFNDEVIFHSRMIFQSSVTTSALVDTLLYNLYSSNDLRRQLFFKINSDKTISFRGMYNNNVNNFTGLATDEVYLIRAECYARKGNTSLATNDLNTVLQKRWKNGTFLPFAASNAEEALLLVLEERKKELLLRGLRWSDLRRLNRDSRFQINLARTVNGITHSLEPISYKYTIAIPDDIIRLSGIPQNLGWD